LPQTGRVGKNMSRDSLNTSAGIARGYLNEDFLVFHLQDCHGEQFAEHFHDFCKIIVFIAGKVTYLVEGRSYRLRPWDVLLITGREIHRPIISPDKRYERYVLWIKPEFLADQSLSDSNLSACFENAFAQCQSLLRPTPEAVGYLQSLLQEIDRATTDRLDGAGVTKRAYLLLLLVYLNRLYRQGNVRQPSADSLTDPIVAQVIEYINRNLAGDLRVGTLAEQFYLSESHLVHKFRKQTGYSLHSFILQKRLLAAHGLIKQGSAYMEASMQCGFGDYSSFVRAFSKYFGRSPRKYFGQGVARDNC
jgi:AraC-like DNA-binding protein